MAGQVFWLKRRDLSPILDVVLKKPDGSIQDLAGTTAYKLHIAMPDGKQLIRTMTKVGADADGHLRYVWVATDFDAASAADANGAFTVGGLVAGPGTIQTNGRYALKPTDVEPLMEYEVTSGPMTFPNDGHDILRIVPDIGETLP